MDDPFSGDDRQHRSWRDLPPTPPLVWPTTPQFATAAAGASPMPAATASKRPRRRLVIGAALLVAAVVLVGTGLLATGNPIGTLLAAAAGGPGAAGNGGGVLPPNAEPLADMAERLLPSVVQIEADGAMGSGFVAADGGLILTASHVVGRSETVTLRLQDGTSVSGTVVAVDKSIDTAVIRADESATDLKPLPLGALADVQVGEMTIAIGSPFGLSQTVTTGIVSALGRTVPTPMGELHDLIQTDAAINSGNSGGPLIDGEGRAIGINTAIASASGGSDGIGFAVPVDQAKQILDKVKDGTWNPEDNNPADSPDALGWALRPVPRARRARRSGRPVRTRARRIAGAGFRRVGHGRPDAAPAARRVPAAACPRCPGRPAAGTGSRAGRLDRPGRRGARSADAAAHGRAAPESEP